jgi:glycosyltransferase involved in cell wall biosynthesis
LNSAPDISIVVPTYNRQELLPHTLRALAKLNRRGFTYEVIFANDGSSDSTSEILDDAVAKWPETFRHLLLQHSGSPARPRNTGISVALGRLLVLLDDDIVPDPDFLVEHFRFHEQHPAEHMAALGELYQPDEILNDPMSLFHSFPYEELRGRVDDLEFLYFWSCNFSAKTSFLRRHGLFNENPVLHPVEDMEWGYRLMRQNMKTRFIAAARGKHLHKICSDDVVAKGERTGRAQFALIQMVPDTSIHERFGIVSTALPPWRILYRAMRRAAFRIVDNPVTIGVLKTLGAQKSHRNRITDAYYYLIFRRSIVAGFKAAKREQRRQPRAFRCERVDQNGM